MTRVYQPPTRELQFHFLEMLRIGRYHDLPAFSDAAPDVIEQILVDDGLPCMWALMASVSQTKLEAGTGDPFYASKLATGRYFPARIPPDAGARPGNVNTGAAAMTMLPAEAF